MRIIVLKGLSIDEARRCLSGIYTKDLNVGDLVEITLKDGSRQVYIFTKQWEDNKYEIRQHIIRPECSKPLKKFLSEWWNKILKK